MALERGRISLAILLSVVSCGSGERAVTLASAQAPGAMAVDASSVYWIDYSGGASSIRKVPIAGGVPVTVFSGRAWAIAADAANLYWIGDDALMKLPSSGGALVALTSSPRFGLAIAVDGANVFWTDTEGVYKVDAGGTVTTLFSGTVYFLAASRGSVYFVIHECPACDQNGCLPCGHNVMKMSADGGPAVVLARETRSGSPGAIAVDDESVYWALDDTGTIAKVPVAGGPTTTLFEQRAEVLYRIQGMASDGARLYWGIYDGRTERGSLMGISTTGGPAITLANDEWRPLSVAVDAKNVYWSDGEARTNGIFPGSIRMMRR